MKGSHSFSILQGKEKRCYLTDAENVPLEKHHIYFGKRNGRYRTSMAFGCGCGQSGTEEHPVCMERMGTTLICF